MNAKEWIIAGIALFSLKFNRLVLNCLDELHKLFFWERLTCIRWKRIIRGTHERFSEAFKIFIFPLLWSLKFRGASKRLFDVSFNYYNDFIFPFALLTHELLMFNTGLETWRILWIWTSKKFLFLDFNKKSWQKSFWVFEISPKGFQR